jgi:hypothetical protein
MRGGDASESLVSVPVPQVVSSVPQEVMPTTTQTVTDKLKNATRKATDWLKGWFGVGQQTQNGGRTRKNKKH